MDTRGRILETNARLDQVFGTPKLRGGDPVKELVGCILSQATTDAQSGAAYDALFKKYPTWEMIHAARASDIARVIKQSGLANEKARYIKNALDFIKRERGAYTLDFLCDMPVADARRWLTQIHGVGPKTASIVLLFALKMPVMPVDTHVHRVTRRLGWISDKTSADKAHEILEALVPPRLYYPLHINLIRLGREICHARTPRCEMCPLTDLCDYFQRNQPHELSSSSSKSPDQ